MTNSNLPSNLYDVNALFEHLELMHNELEVIEKDNQQLTIEVAELRGVVVKLEQQIADKDVHIIQMHSDLERAEYLLCKD